MQSLGGGETTVGIIEAAGGALHMSREGLALGRVSRKQVAGMVAVQRELAV